MDLNWDPGEGTSDGRGSSSNGTKVTIKQELEIKEEELSDGTEFDRVRQQIETDALIAANLIVESESDTDSDGDAVVGVELNPVEYEVKIEPGNVKRECGGASNEHSNGNKHDPKPHKCPHCDYATSRKSHLIQHLRTHTGEKPFTCDICLKSFSRKASLNKHMRVHGSEFPVQCSKCGRGFALEILKTKHEIKCMVREHKCPSCEYSTRYKHVLQQHMLIHSKRRRFKCSICFKKFFQKVALNDHSRTHINQLVFSCSKCGNRFAEEEDKRLHERRCKRRRYECYRCSYECYKTIDLKRHMQVKHTGNGMFECEICGKKFSRKDRLNRHLDIQKNQYQ